MDKPKPIFADGMTFSKPREGAPEWIKGNVAVKADAFKAFLTDNQKHLSEKGWLYFDLKQSKNGTLYFELNTWKPTQKKEAEIDVQNIPF